jgi:cytoskeletal protein RodZ
MVFVMRPLETAPKKLGEKLRHLRRTQAISLEMLEKMTRVRRHYLEALEWGRYEILPDPLYTRNFIRSYARALQADETYFLELYTEESGRTDLLDPHRMPRERVKKASFFVWTKALSALVLLFVAVGVMGYLGWQIKSLLAPPQVIVLNPLDQSAVDSALLLVEGYVQSDEVQVAINGKSVIVNEDKTFEMELDLTRGLNVIKIEAKRRYSRPAIIYRRVVFESEVSIGDN